MPWRSSHSPIEASAASSFVASMAAPPAIARAAALSNYVGSLAMRAGCCAGGVKRAVLVGVKSGSLLTNFAERGAPAAMPRNKAPPTKRARVADPPPALDEASLQQAADDALVQAWSGRIASGECDIQRFLDKLRHDGR